MDKEKKTEIRVGLTVLIALILFGFIYGWSKNYSLSSNKEILKIEFPTVAGLEIGDLVSVNGVRKGLVESIISDGGKALVNIEFNEPVTLKSDATFSIMMLDLMGGKKIEIASGSSNELLDFSKKHNGKFAGDISTAMATLHSVESDLVVLLRELKTSIENLNNVTGNKNFAQNVNSSLSQLNKLTANMNAILTENREGFNDLLVATEKLVGNSNDFIEQNGSNINSLILGLDSAVIVSKTLITQMSTVIDETMQSNNNLGKFLYDEHIISDLKRSLKQINKLTKTINNQLENGGLEVKADVDLF